MDKQFFLKMVRQLRRHEEIVLYQNIFEIKDGETEAVAAFLKAEYLEESIEYPFEIPIFNIEAATWAAKTIYIAAQLLLYRKNKVEDLPSLLQAFPTKPTSDSILSADLCLRFLPDILVELKIIDSSDPLIEILEKILHQWHYSGVNYNLDIEQLDFAPISDHPCLLQLYCNRVVQYKKLHLANLPALQDSISANLGTHGNELWKDFNKKVEIESSENE